MSCCELECADIGIVTDEYQRARTARLLNERPHTKPAPCAGCLSARGLLRNLSRRGGLGVEVHDAIDTWLREHP